MLFSSTIFLFGFLPTVLLLYFVVFRSIRWRNYLLLLFSLVFYAWGEPAFVFVMGASIIINYGLGLAISKACDPSRKRLWLILAVVIDLSLLFCFKYLNFVVDNVNQIFGSRWVIPVIRLPIGISFFTFQAMSYVIDVYRGSAEVQKNPLHLGLYIAFFPQLIAGPIVRYNTIAQQILHREVNLDIFQSGLYRFIQGVAKKVILSNTMSLIAEEGFLLASNQGLSVATAWLGALAYTFQIFFDFSGYSDMAIGLGRMFGFEFEENFRYPYLSKTVSEFWNRWHISLGQWFRDYVYFPLGGSRVNKPKLIRNLFVVWTLTGIWHGAAWQFILWGIGYGVIISIEKLTGLPKRMKQKPTILLYGLFTFLIVNMGWVIFGAPQLSTALSQLGAMIGVGATTPVDATARYIVREYLPFYLAAAIFSTPIVKLALGKLKQGALYDFSMAFIHMALLMISVSYLAIDAHNPFIYFNF